MNCRDARPLIGSIELLRESQRRQIEAHLQACPACRDDLEDAQALALLNVSLAPATPTPDFTQRVLLRLPEASPIAIARKKRRVQRLGRQLGVGVAAALSLGAVGGLFLLQQSGMSAGAVMGGMLLPVALVAKAVLVAIGKSWLSIGAAFIVMLLPLVWARLTAHGFVRRPFRTGSVAAAGAALAAVLLANVVVLHEDVGTLTSALSIRARTAGDVASLAGDIRIDGEVMGDVIALGGRVALGPSAVVHGSVLAGSGMVADPGVRVDQRQLNGWTQLPALAWAINSSPVVSITPTTAARVAAGGLGIVIFLLAALIVIVWPEWSAAAGASLTRFPMRALLLGVATSAGIICVTIAISVLLAATIMGIVVVPILWLLLHLPFVGGIAAVGNVFGRALTGSPGGVGAMWGVAIQLLLLLGVGLLFPAASVLAFYLLAGVGVGGNVLVATEGL